MVFPSSPGKLFKIIPIGDLGAIKNFKDMATEKNSKGSVKKIFSACWKVVENIGKGIGKGILITIVLIGMILFWFNPIFFLPISLLAPKAAADSLYDLDIEIFSDFWRAFYQPWVAILPMRWKKHFMAVRGISEYSPHTQVKYYRLAAAEEKDNILGKMTIAAQSELWKFGNADERIRLAGNGYRPTISQLRALDTVVLEHVLVAYGKARNTFSEDILNLLIDRNLGNLFFGHVRKNGLSPRVINRIFSGRDIKKEDVQGWIAATQEALECFSERQTVTRSQQPGNVAEWELFLKEIKESGKELNPSAQCLMSIAQYIEFHKMGFNLSREVIYYFLSLGQETICKYIFAYEPAESFTDKAKALIDANPKLKSWQLLSVAEA